ncbi:Auxin-responsive protein IAA8 [Hibiscus syriacus]|uniref:Auxin-responsive protein n=1 Tax=Hibiscus syriacus TaxID=106335 RepID=A0A6A2YWA7_HIBSY|nr:auxin-responsive protein IAA8-like [Hibiscus syriacus]KAE8683315.1 Auxin-responsive protein IAA8 [Hibiscus syriacus]
MSPPLLSVEDEGGLTKITSLDSSGSVDSVCQNNAELKERNYMGLSDCTPMDISIVSLASEQSKSSLNLKATELSLGLPGSQMLEINQDLCLLSTAQLDEKPLFPLHPSSDGHCTALHKTIVSGNKRRFSDAMDEFPEGDFLSNSKVSVMPSSRPSSKLGLKSGYVLENLGPQSTKAKEITNRNVVHDRPHAAKNIMPDPNVTSNNNSEAPVSKAQVVGWPPIRSFRKNSLASNSKNTDEVDGKVGPGALFVKVSMDGAPYLRKVDLRNYYKYQELSSALEKMFRCFTLDQCGSHGTPGRELLSESKMEDLLHRSEYVLTYEDKDGDWMLVGDVPWEMFIDTCKRLRIMKSSDAIGLGIRASLHHS